MRYINLHFNWLSGLHSACACGIARRGNVQQSAHHEHRVRRGSEAIRVPVLRLSRCWPDPRGRPKHVLVPAATTPHVRSHRRDGIQVRAPSLLFVVITLIHLVRWAEGPRASGGPIDPSAVRRNRWRRIRLLRHISSWRGLSVCRLFVAPCMFKPFDGFRCRLAVTCEGSIDLLCEMGSLGGLESNLSQKM